MEKVIALLISLVLLASSCGPVSTTGTENFVVTGNADGAPAGCSPHEVARRFVEMFDAMNRGDPGVVDEYFGRQQGAPFGWYSMTETGNTEAEKNDFVAHDWDELAAYFEQRYNQHERLELRSVQFNGWEGARGVVHFGPIVITRHADDLRPVPGGPEGLANGKGAYHCKTQAVVVLSLAMDVQ